MGAVKGDRERETKRRETERRETNLEIKDIPIDVDDLGFRFGV